jgi:hypothetical protein
MGTWGQHNMHNALVSSHESSATSILCLRLSVGFLGERDGAGWWRSGFTSPTAPAFLAPIFGAKVLHAQYQGLIESARRVHDERIGVGRVFHPFRLPEAQEQRVLDALRTDREKPTNCIPSHEAAMNDLQYLAGQVVDVKPGPILIGPIETLEDPSWVTKVATVYLAAFNSNIQCFPYFSNTQ